jgi:hypothetical protein
MPPKKRKRKAKTPKSRPTQSQSQRVTINIGSTSKSKPRKYSGRGNLPPPSHMHNLAPTFVTAPQVDYTPLLAMMQHHSSPIVAQAPMPVQNPTTPLSSANVATNTASQMAGLAAEARRAGPTAGNFQPPASLGRSVSELAAMFDRPNFGNKPDPLSRDVSALSSQTASTRLTLPGRGGRSSPLFPQEPMRQSSAAAEQSSSSSSSSLSSSEDISSAEERDQVTSKLTPSKEYLDKQAYNRNAAAKYRQQLKDNTPTIIAKIDRGETLTANELRTIKAATQSKAGKSALSRYEKRKL